MNRIILIGNGFDLAHDLDTSYKHFIDDLWRVKIENFKRTTFVEEDIEFKGLVPYNSMLPINVKTYIELNEFIKNSILQGSRGRVSLVFKNEFLKSITDKSTSNWVDVEDEYFEELLRVVKADRNDKDKISKLNADFLSIKKSLDEYISKEFEKKEKTLERHPDIYGEIFSNFNIEDFSKVGLESFIEEVTFELESIIEESNENNFLSYDENQKKLYNHVIKENEQGKFYLDKNELNNLFRNHDYARHFFNLKPSNYLFLNFNYTKTETLYTTFIRNSFSDYKPDVEINHIHGEVGNTDNPIIFGYGDEIGKDYAVLEEVKNNDLLENVKSIRYLDTENYKKLLEYLESDKYQIFIMGHSCGNSDRTLLNTLFEHENCVSIKVFYYQESQDKDNYSDIIRNISRNFNDKKMMREKVVNKKYCSPLISSIN